MFELMFRHDLIDAQGPDLASKSHAVFDLFAWLVGEVQAEAGILAPIHAWSPRPFGRPCTDWPSFGSGAVWRAQASRPPATSRSP
jgi:hypothetical protein